MWTGLDHVSVAVEDVDAATGPMARLLGRRPSWRGEEPEAGVENVLFKLANTTLELLAPVGPGERAELCRERLAAQGPGPVALALGVEDAAACAAALRARGIDAAEPRRAIGRDVQSGAFRRWWQVALPRAQTRGVALCAIEREAGPDVLPEAPVLFAAEAAAQAVDHVVVQSPTPEAARALLGEQLGLRLALDRSFPSWGMRLLFFRVGGLTLEVASPLEAPPAQTDADALWGISYRVPDAQAAHARLEGLGFELSPVRDGRKPGTRVFRVRDAPCGVATLMLEASAGPAC